MANYCKYKVMVKGKKNACYAFFGSMSCADDKYITKEFGKDDRYTLYFEGYCKWTVDAYCKPWKGEFPVTLPEDADEAYKEGEDKYWYNTVKERSKMFGVEVKCNSCGEEDFGWGDYDEDFDEEFDEEALEEVDEKNRKKKKVVENIGYYEHYKNGEPIDDNCPKNLYIVSEAEW